MAEHATTPAPQDLASQNDTMDTRAHTLGVGSLGVHLHAG